MFKDGHGSNCSQGKKQKTPETGKKKKKPPDTCPAIGGGYTGRV